MIFQSLLLLSVVSFGQVWGDGVCSSSWSYNNTQAWGEQCNGNRQSPIHIYTLFSSTVHTFPLIFGNYDKPLQSPLTLENNGHTVNLNIPATTDGGRPFIVGGLLPNRYDAQSLHFHWGSPGVKGSEHTIDNRRYDVEMHIVHKNVIYESMTEAMKHPDGISVLGIMFKGVDDPDHYYPGLDKIFERLPQLINCGSTANITNGLTMAHILGDLNTKDFFTYAGSLTTPPCSQAVIWNVFPRPLPVANENIQRFFQLLDTDGNPLVNNFRPIQPRNNRPVYHRISDSNI